MIAALALVALLSPGNVRRNAAMVFFGLILALPGMDPVHGTERMTANGIRKLSYRALRMR